MSVANVSPPSTPRVPRVFNRDGTRGEEPRPNQPSYIRRCWEGAYTLRLVNPKTKEVKTVRPTCGSWRHEGPCQGRRFFQDSERIKDALADVPLDDILFCVFTMDPGEWDNLGNRPKRGQAAVEVPISTDLQITHMFKGLKESFRILRFGTGSYDRRTRQGDGIRDALGITGHVATVEIQRRGWPHLNAIFVGPGLGAQARLLTQSMKRAGLKNKDEIGRRVARAVLGERILDRSGFGFAWADGATSKERLAKYVTKLAEDKKQEPIPGEDAQAKRVADLKVRGISTAQAGEMAKVSQVPFNAEPHFRRLRPSPGFLAPLRKKGELTGCLLNTKGEAVSGEAPEELPLVVAAARSLMNRWGVTERSVGRNDAFREAMEHVDRVLPRAVRQAVLEERVRYQRDIGEEHPLSEQQLATRLIKKRAISVLVEIKNRLSSVSGKRHVVTPPSANVMFDIGVATLTDDGECYCIDTGRVFTIPGTPAWEREAREVRVPGTLAWIREEFARKEREARRGRAPP